MNENIMGHKALEKVRDYTLYVGKRDDKKRNDMKLSFSSRGNENCNDRKREQAQP